MAEAILEPKPAAPSLAPAAPAAPASAPAAPAAPAADDNPYSDVDAMMTKAGYPEAKPKDAAPDRAPPAPKDEKKPAAPAKPIPTASDKAPGVPKELRAELDRVKGELKTKSESYAALEAKIKDYEARGKDTEALVAQLETERKEKDQLKADLRRARKEVEPDFVKAYETPFQEMSNEARSVIPTIQIEDPDTGAIRSGDWDNFVKLYGYNEFLATKEAKKMFGEDGAPVAMRYYMEIHRLQKIKDKALNEVHSKWKEQETADQAKAAEEKVKAEKHQEEVNQFWTKANADLAEKVEDYHDSPEDKELVEVRQKALAKFDERAKTLKEQIIKDAHNRQRVAAFPVLRLKLTRAQKEISDLKAELDGLKEKPPGRGARPGGTGGEKPTEGYEEYIRKSVTA